MMSKNDEGEYEFNPNSKRGLTCYAEPSVTDTKQGERFQFFRHGYYIADSADSNVNGSTDEKVFNQIVGLKSSWKPTEV